MDALAAEAFLNAEHRVCGLLMRPLSLGHSFTLEAVCSPFFHGRTGSEGELRLAAWICSRPALALPKTSGFKYGWFSTRKIDFESECAKWATYVADYCAAPQMWKKASKPSGDAPAPSGIPSPITTVVRLMRLGMTESQAWATPVGIAAWYEAAAYESETGERLEIVTDAERDAIARKKAREMADMEGKN